MNRKIKIPRRKTGRMQAAGNKKGRRAPRRTANARITPPPTGFVRLNRMSTIFAALLLVYVGLMARAWHLQVRRHDHYAERAANQHERRIPVRARRGQIRDARGQVLADTADGYSIAVFREDLGPERAQVAQQLASILGLDAARLIRKLTRSPKGFTWLKRHVTPQEAQAVKAASLPGVVVKVEQRRFYPKRALAGALLGFTNIDGLGAGGLEKAFDRYLQGRTYTIEALRDAQGHLLLTDGYLPAEKLRGMDVELTLDSYLQQIAEEALADHVKQTKAKNGLVVMMSPTTGDILAMAQTPSFDPNLYRSSQPEERRNRAVTDLLEPGSTVKPLLVSSALDAGVVRPNSVFDGMKGRMQIGRRFIRDSHREDSFTALEVVQKSSNIGAVQIAQRLGKTRYHDYLRAFGFGEPTDSGLAGEQGGVLRDARRWGVAHLATHAYGYGLSVTPLQAATAMAALANDGVLMRPRVVSRVVDSQGKTVKAFPPRAVRQVIGKKAARQIREALIMVTQSGGTGTRAVVPGFVVAGKTGTSHKATQGGYSRDRVAASFSGFAPAHDPRVVIYVMIDEPMADKRQAGGSAAAPVFADIARKALPYLGVQPTEPYAMEALAQPEPPMPELDAQAAPWWLTHEEIAGAHAHRKAPDLKGMAFKEVVKEVKALGRSVEIEGAGVVVSQHPQAGTPMPPDQTLKITLALPGVSAPVAAATPGEPRR